MHRKVTALAGAAALALAAAVVPALPASADAPSGAIFTTLPDGSEVNFNIYDSKDDVYLDGGPGPGAPQTAAGLDDGTYVFQITDPSGKALLSTDPARCRQFTVAGGVITGVVAQPDGCQHVTGTDVDHGATTVQMMPYLDTPNNGGEYKAWATTVTDFKAGCVALGQNDGLNVVNCGSTGGNKHGFVGSDSKTDNFKVGPQVPQEIDTRFYDRNGQLLDGLGVTWTDTHGASNKKWSYYAPSLSVYHEAHVENVEPGTHTITIANQTGCAVKAVRTGGKTVASGPASVGVKVTATTKSFTTFIDVTCG
jgi:hypothetical protein